MPTFVTLYRYTQQGARNVKESPARIAAARKSAEEAGGRLKAIYVTMGQYDLVAITEWPTDEAAAAAVLAQGSLGNVTTETMRAFTEDEFKVIVAKLP